MMAGESQAACPLFTSWALFRSNRTHTPEQWSNPHASTQGLRRALHSNAQHSSPSPCSGFALAQDGSARPQGLPLTRVLPERRGAADLSKADTLTRPCFTGRWVHRKARALRSVSLLPLPVSCGVRAGDVLPRPGPLSHPRFLHPSGEPALGRWRRLLSSAGGLAG